MTRIVPTAIDRRALLKSSAAAGAALAAGIAMPAIAQTRADQARLCQPADRAARRVRRSRQLHHRQFQGSRQGRHQARQRHRSGRSRRQGQPVKSEPRRAGRKGSDRQDKIDLMLVASTPETTNPVSTQCEIEEVPCISTVAPWQPWFIGRQADPAGGPPAWKTFNYTYHFFWGLEDVIAVFTNMWSQVADQQIGRRPVSERRRRQCLGRQAGRLPAGAGESAATS